MATICKLCKKDYKYLSKLKRHRDGEYGCKYIDNNGSITLVNNNSIILNTISNLPISIEPTTNIELTKNVISNIESTIEPTGELTVEPTIVKCKSIEQKIINETKSSCIKCTKEFTTKYSLARHINENRCRIIKEKIKEISKYNINFKNECKQQKKEKKLKQLVNLEQLDNLEKQIETKIIETKIIENLQIQIKLQEQELQVLRQIKHQKYAQTNTLPIENKDKFTTNFIYLIIEKEYITNNEDIFKIGKTTQKRLKRFDKYKSGSILLSYNRCTDCHKSEKEIIKFFKIKYKQRLDIGLEYFEGNHEDMINDIYSIIKFNK